jgi:hypothetical protein
MATVELEAGEFSYVEYGGRAGESGWPGTARMAGSAHDQ